MIEELPDDIDNDELDDVEPVGDEAQLYEHFRVVVDKGQEMVRVDKYLFDRLTNSSRNRIQKAADAGFVMANGKAVKSSYKVKPMDGKYEVTLSARQLARDVFIEIPVQGARFTDNFFDLLPGQTKKVIITSDKLKKNEKVDITIKQLSDTN